MNLKAISPVIATVIIVSVAIAIAVAVAFWMTGITGLFTRYEKLEIVSAYATAQAGGGWTVTLIVRNTGTTDVTIDNIFINGIPYNTLEGANAFSDLKADGDTVSEPLSIALKPGDSKTITFDLTSEGTYKFTSGQVVEVKLHTAAGNEYPKSVQLP